MIPVNEPLLDGNEKKYLSECIDTGWISSEGPFVKRFEEGMAQYVGRKHAVAVTNGSAALELAVAALKLHDGDEVIMPTFTIISCAQALLRHGVTPVLVDSDATTWNMNAADIEAKITPKTKAIMIVHIYGLPVDIDPIMALAKKYDLKIIEDAAEMIGQEYKNKKCGSFGDISIFSFYPNKHITTGEGGMVLCDDDELHERCKSLKNLCFQGKKRFVHEELGYNFRMSNIQAALGVAQLERIEEFVEKKRYIGKMYTDLLSDIDAIQLPLEKTDYSNNIYWVFGILIKEECNKTAEDIMMALKEYTIGTRPFFCPMHKQPVFKNMGMFVEEQHPIAENLYEKGLYIPSGMAITEEQMAKVSESLHKVVFV